MSAGTNFESLVGYKIESVVNCNLGEDGFWKATHTLTQSKTIDGENWDTRKVELSVYNEDMYEAMSSSYITLIIYIQSLGGDLFNADGGDIVTGNKMSDSDLFSADEDDIVTGNKMSDSDSDWRRLQ